ncbi:MAG TPA: hypothetical protein VMM13_15295 [Euzebya sp.]|nr:hypothetical protein [Euzebya sp.]
MKTILAVIAAAALIAGALFVRTEVLDGRSLVDGVTDGSQVAVGEEAPQPEEDVRVACDAALGDGCPAGAGRLSLDALLTAFQQQEVAFEVLIAPSAVVELIESSQTSQARFGNDRTTIATTPLIAVVQASQAEAVEQACGTDVTWRCLGELIEDGGTRTAFPDPRSRTEGITVLAALAGGFFETTSYNANSFGDAAFLGWLDGVRAGSSTDPDPVLTLIARSGAENNSAITIEATGLLTAQQGSDRLATEIYWPAPVASLSVVAVGIGGADPDAAADTVDAAGQALGEAGWRGPDGAPIDGGPAIGDDDGLPSGGVLFSLRGEWN